MYSTYRLQADELTEQFVAAIKRTYQHRNIEIIVQEVEDETEYLMSSAVNREHLLKSIENVEGRKKLVQVQMDSL